MPTPVGPQGDTESWPGVGPESLGGCRSQMSPSGEAEDAIASPFAHCRSASVGRRAAASESEGGQMLSVGRMQHERRVGQERFSGHERRRPIPGHDVRVRQMPERSSWLVGECSCGQTATSIVDGLVEAWVTIHRWQPHSGDAWSGRGSSN